MPFAVGAIAIAGSKRNIPESAKGREGSFIWYFFDILVQKLCLNDFINIVGKEYCRMLAIFNFLFALKHQLHLTYIHLWRDN